MGIIKNNEKYYLKLEVTNTNKESIEKLLHIFQCGSIHKVKATKSTHKNAYRCHVNPKDVIKVCKLLEPYCVNKKEHIKIILSGENLYRLKDINKRGLL